MLHFLERDPASSLRLGAILGGGQSRRFGRAKQTAEVGGVTLVERVATSLRQAGATPVLIHGPASPDLAHLLPCRVDQRPGMGPLGGLQTALSWARELGLRGTLCVACDLPFLPPALLRRLAERGEESRDVVVAPESRGPLGLEPLCAWYPTRILPTVDERLEAGALSLDQLLRAVAVSKLPVTEVATFGDVTEIFLNVNTPVEGAAAESIHAGRKAGRGGS